jgi:hypothetical protein
MVTGLFSVPVPSWSIVSLVLAPSAATVTKSLKLEVALYPINKSLRSIISVSATIKDGSFNVDDISVVNSTINSDSFTKVSETQYTIIVTPSLGGKHSNVAITVVANTFTDVAGNINVAIVKNTT